MRVFYLLILQPPRRGKNNPAVRHIKYHLAIATVHGEQRRGRHLAATFNMQGAHARQPDVGHHHYSPHTVPNPIRNIRLFTTYLYNFL
jgi:hypothetical protein